MERIERMDYRVLVSVSNPKTATSLVELGAGLARRRRGDLIVMSVAEVPEGEALLRGRHIVPKLEPVLTRRWRTPRPAGSRPGPWSRSRGG